MTHPDHTIPNGYKLTEVGVIPDDWEVKTIGEIFQFLNTGSNPRDNLSDYGDYKYIHYGDIHTKWLGFLDCSIDSIPRIDRQKVAHLPLIKDGDLVMVDASEDYNGIGASIEIYNVNDQLIVAGLHTFLLRADHEIIKDGFKGYIQNIDIVKSQLRALATGISVFGISKLSLKDVKLPIPPLQEQQAIVEVLSQIDDQITALEESIAKKRELKQGAMQRLLTGEERLAGFSGAWEVKRLGEISNVFSGGTPSTTVSEYYNGNISWITSSDLNKGRIFSVGGRITELGLQNSSAKMINAHTLLIALYGATAGVVAISEIEAAINQAVLAIIPSNDNIEFIFYLLSKLKDSIVETYTQGGQPNLSGNIVKSIELTFPPLEEQQAIADVLSNMDAEISALEAERDKTITLKQGMMQELLTGKTRLI